MKLNSFHTVSTVLLIAGSLSAQETFLPDGAPQSRAAFSIVQAAENGNTLDELRGLPKEQALPLLGQYAASKSAFHDRAVNLLKQLQAEQFFKDRIQSIVLDSPTFAERLHNAFGALGAMRTKASVRALADGALNDDSPAYQSGDYALGPKWFLAIWTLIYMNLPDAPPYHKFGADSDLPAWRDWWRSHRQEYQDDAGIPIGTQIIPQSPQPKVGNDP